MENQAIVQHAVTATATAAVVTALIPLVKTTAEKITDFYYEFNSKDKEEFDAIKKFWKENCAGERKNLVLTTFITGQPKTEEEIYPIYFELAPQKNYPLLYDKNFALFTNEYEWQEYLGFNMFRPAIEEMFAWISEYQTQRSQRPWGKGYPYDPTNLFFEEFKIWLIQLSKVEINEDTKKCIENRISYLKKIYHKHDLFEPGNTKPTRKDTILKLTDILEKNVLPMLKEHLERKNAREHFFDLRNKIHLSLRHCLNFCFYIFKNQKTSSNFIIDEIRSPKLVQEYVDALLNKPLTIDRLLQILLNTPLFLSIYPPTGTNNSQQELSVLENPLMDHFGKISLPFIDVEVNNENWFLYENEKHKIFTGILSSLRNKDIAQNYLKLLSDLYQFGLFYLIASELYELAGEGGNILVYKFAHNQTVGVLTNFAKLFASIQSNIKDLYEMAEIQSKSIIAKGKKIKEDEKLWRQSFDHTFSTNERLKKCFEGIKNTLNAIDNKIKEVNQKDYTKRIQQKLMLLEVLSQKFSNYLEPKDSKSSLKDSGSLLFLEPVQQTELSAIEKMINEEKYEEALRLCLQSRKAASEKLFVEYSLHAALCQKILGNPIRAIQSLNEALEKQPNSYLALYQKILFHEDSGEIGLAFESCKNALQYYPLDKDFKELYKQLEKSIKKISKDLK